MTRYDNMQKQYAHKKKGEKDTNKNKCNQKKKNDDKNDERFTMCQKHTSYTLLTLLFYVKKKTRETTRNGGKRSAILLCPECQQTIV